MWDNEFGPNGTANSGAYADKSYWICTENWDDYTAVPNQNYPIDKNVYNQFGGFNDDNYVPLFVVVGAGNKVYYDAAGFNQSAIEAAIRLAINEMPAPGNSVLTTTSFNPSTAPDTSTSDSFDLGNDGTGELLYSFSIDYTGVEAAGSTWESNDFESVIGYTNSGDKNWETYAGGDWNGNTQCANAQDNGTSIMTSTAFNTTGAGDRLWFEFRYGMAYETGAVFTAEYWDGSSWVEVWSLAEGAVGTAKIVLPTKAADTQIRFTAVSLRVQGTFPIMRVDNISVYSDDQSYKWLLFDQINEWGEPIETGSVPTGNSSAFNLIFDAAGLAEGTYNADIKITCSDPEDSPLTIPVEFVVSSGGGGDPAQPANVVTSISGSDIVLDWDVSADATSYDVYSSDDPYGTFTFVVNVATNQYIVAADQAKLFYHIVAKN